MNEIWTEKYRPQSLKDIVGNPTSAESMRQWALSWQKGIPKYRAMVLIGTPGIGKTSAAEALARDMGWGIIEMNASDQRTGPAIENVAGRAAIFNSFGEDGKFTILQVADVQDNAFLSYFCKRSIIYAVKEAQPDLIVLTGDNISGPSCRTELSAKKAIKDVMDVFERLGVPVAMVSLPVLLL